MDDAHKGALRRLPAARFLADEVRCLPLGHAAMPARNGTRAGLGKKEGESEAGCGRAAAQRGLPGTLAEEIAAALRR